MPTVINKRTGKSTQLNESSDLLGEGGEGRVFGKGNEVFKIYINPSDVISLEKIRELQKIKYKNVFIPKDMLVDRHGKPIGFTTNRVKNFTYLTRLFITSFWDKNNITVDNIVALTKEMQHTIKHIHAQQVLMVDGNEMNYLVDSKTYQIPYFIDVNAWQTPSYPATVIMPNIRDHHSSKFSEFTDWFSFGIVSCQLFTGLHPYKGRHPQYAGRKQLEARMKANVSIFNKDTKIPGAVRDLAIIPPNLKEWYIRMFEKGERLEPPMIGKHTFTFEDKPVVITNENFYVQMLVSLPHTITHHYGTSENDYLQTKEKVYQYDFITKALKEYDLVNKNSRILIDPIQDQKAYEVFIENTHLHIRTLGQSTISDTKYKADEIMIIDNRLYIKTDDKFQLMRLFKGRTGPMVASATTLNVAAQATQLFDGMLYSLIGQKHYLYFPQKNNIIKTFISEHLTDRRVLDAKYENGICMLRTMNKKTGIEEYVLYMNVNDATDVQIKPTTVSILNFVSLQKKSSPFVYLHEDGKLTLLPKDGSTAGKVVEHRNLTTNLKLTRSGDRVGLLTRHKFYRVSTKKSTRKNN